MRQTNKSAKKKRKDRVRAKLLRRCQKPRLCVFRSNKSIYAQIIDDEKGITLVSASEADRTNLDSKNSKRTKSQKAELVGQILTKKAIKNGIKEVIFDRGAYKYHGRVRRLAESARKEGLKF